MGGGERCIPLGGNILIGGNNLFAACYRNVSEKKAYRKTGTRDPSGTLQKPENRDPSGTLQKPENRDPSGTLKKLGIIYKSISFKICKVNMKCKYFQKLEI